ncbi:hypothetical protein ACLMJK_004566 [Lecanora helva]
MSRPPTPQPYPRLSGSCNLSIRQDTGRGSDFNSTEAILMYIWIHYIANENKEVLSVAEIQKVMGYFQAGNKVADVSLEAIENAYECLTFPFFTQVPTIKEVIKKNPHYWIDRAARIYTNAISGRIIGPLPGSRRQRPVLQGSVPQFLEWMESEEAGMGKTIGPLGEHRRQRSASHHTPRKVHLATGASTTTRQILPRSQPVPPQPLNHPWAIRTQQASTMPPQFWAPSVVVPPSLRSTTHHSIEEHVNGLSGTTQMYGNHGQSSLPTPDREAFSGARCPFDKTFDPASSSSGQDNQLNDMASWQGPAHYYQYFDGNGNQFNYVSGNQHINAGGNQFNHVNGNQYINAGGNHSSGANGNHFNSIRNHVNNVSGNQYLNANGNQNIYANGNQSSNTKRNQPSNASENQPRDAEGNQPANDNGNQYTNAAGDHGSL